MRPLVDSLTGGLATHAVLPACEAAAAEIQELRARVIDLEDQIQLLGGVASTSSRPPLALHASDASASIAPVMMLSVAPQCTRKRMPRTNLALLLPSTPDADLSLHDGRCSRRYVNLEAAWEACMAEPECTGVVRDNGLSCPIKPHERVGRSRRRQGDLMKFELRGGAVQSGASAAWVCLSRLSAFDSSMRGTRVASWAQPNATMAIEGYLFIILGPCSLPDLGCPFIRDAREAIRTVRHVDSKRPIAIVTDGGVHSASLLKATRADIVKIVPAEVAAAAGEAWTTKDMRVRKLLAYEQSPFERTVFLDGDTRVLSDRVAMLFKTLNVFELAAAFECCRIDWSDSKRPYDKSDFFLGWEMQTGVMAYKRTPRVSAFWAAAVSEYSNRAAFWEHRSSGEQGATTLALARTDVRFMPLPPAFNARPYTLYMHLNVFGVAVYHGHDLPKSLEGRNASLEAIIGKRMLHDWIKEAAWLASEFRDSVTVSPDHVATSLEAMLVENHGG